MKKLLLALLILIPLVTAAQGLITPVDFSQESTVAYKLEDGDGISFYINEKEYIISIDELGTTSARLKSFIYKENGEREVFYVPLGSQYSYKIDFDKDEIYDIKIDLIRIEENKASVLFERISEPKSQNNEVTTNTTKDIINTKGLVITGLIVIAGLIAYFTFKKK